jgi:DNA invertase Pin-like site-specific DNA recombinase
MITKGLQRIAAQYLRVSTEHQQYSLQNQSDAIRAYAEKIGFEIAHTYKDAGKSGLVLNRRDGLRQLLSDVMNGTAMYSVILVYDISRWGRFQDVDEAAHYEFLCKSAGMQIHYCAEQFANDNSLSSSMMKALKRVMAGEYSRELSVKVHEGEKRLARAGFRTGGVPGYGFRRLLVSANRQPKCLLSGPERKSLQTDRVILVPGPENEVRCVRDIFRMFTEMNMSPSEIAGELTRQGVPYTGEKRKSWYGQAVSRLLRHPKYCGCSVFGQSTCRLRMRKIRNPRDDWTITSGAWQPLIDQATFDRAQKRFNDFREQRTDPELLSGLRRLLHEHGSCRKP